MKARYLVLPMIFVGVLSAQPGHGHGSLTPPTPEQMVDREVNMLTKFFGLTSTQATNFKAILTAEQGCMAAIPTPPGLKSPQGARQALTDAIKGNNPTMISAALATFNTVQAAQEACRVTAAASLYAGLTEPGQQAKVGNGLGPLLGGGGPHFGPHPGGPHPAGPRPSGPPPAQ